MTADEKLIVFHWETDMRFDGNVWPAHQWKQIPTLAKFEGLIEQLKKLDEAAVPAKMKPRVGVTRTSILRVRIET